MEESVIKYYELFFSRLISRLDYSFEPSIKQIKIIKNFILLLDKEVGIKSIDDDFIFYFLSYQFMIRKDQKTRFGKGIVPLNHVIGKAAFEKWIDKPENWYYFNDLFLEEYRITKPEKEIKYRRVDHLKQHEELIRSNNEIILCLNSTSLHNKDSPYCRKCLDKQFCIKYKKELYKK